MAHVEHAMPVSPTFPLLQDPVANRASILTDFGQPDMDDTMDDCSDVEDLSLCWDQISQSVRPLSASFS